VLRHRELCNALETSRDALDALIASMSSSSSSSSPSPQPRDKQVENSITIILTYHILLAIWLRIDVLQPEQRESAFDSLEADLEEMLILCERFVANETSTMASTTTTSQPSLRCSSGLGCVMPLHTIAARCRNPQLRRRAIKLLQACSRRDGLWDSRIVAEVSVRTVEVEEERMFPPVLSTAADPATRENGRVREVKIELQGDRAALLRFVVAGQEEIQERIQW
jgi:hypothetical protein